MATFFACNQRRKHNKKTANIDIHKLQSPTNYIQRKLHSCNKIMHNNNRISKPGYVFAY